MFMQFNNETVSWEGDPCNDPIVQVITSRILCLLHKLHCDCMFVACVHWVPEIVPQSLRVSEIWT